MIFNLTPPESTAVEFIEQTLTDAQKAQARTNIGALDSSSLVSTLTMLGYTKVATGSYVGDGTGTAQINRNIDPTSYSPRRISLALTPNVVMLMDNTGCVLTVTKSNAIMGYAQCRFYNSDQGKWYTARGESPTKLAYIEGATLSLISSANAPDSNYQMQGFYTSSVEGSGSLVSVLNISGVTYYYLAF